MKKILLGLGTIAIVTIPVCAVTTCSNKQPKPAEEYEPFEQIYPELGSSLGQLGENLLKIVDTSILDVYVNDVGQKGNSIIYTIIPYDAAGYMFKTDIEYDLSKKKIVSGQLGYDKPATTHKLEVVNDLLNKVSGTK